MPQRIIDLDAAAPEDLGVKCGGKIYDLPGDIPIPDFLEIERAVAVLEGREEAPEGTTATDALQRLYDLVLDLFRVKQPDLEKLPIGPVRLGALIVQIYSAAGDADGAGGGRPPKASTRSTSRSKRSRGSKS